MKTLRSALAGLLLFAAAIPAARAADRLSVMLDWFANPVHAPVIVARQAGFFKDAGLDVAISAPADPNMPPKLVAAGEIDVSMTSEPLLHLQAESGLAIRRIGTMIASPLNCLMVLDKGPVKTIADLKGRKIGYSISGFEDALLSAMLGTAGLTLSDVELVNVNFALSPALLTRRVDAVIGAFRNFELTEIALEGAPGHAFYPEETGVPPYDEMVLIARRSDAPDPRIPRFLAAVERASLFMANHPDAAWKAFVSFDPKALDTEINRRAWKDTLPRFSLSPAALDRGRYVRFADYLKKAGLIERKVPIDGYIALPEALR